MGDVAHPIVEIADLVAPSTGWLDARTGPAPEGGTLLADTLEQAADGSRPGLEQWRRALEAASAPEAADPLVAFVRTCEYVLSVVGVVAAVGLLRLHRVPVVAAAQVAYRLDDDYPYPAQITLMSADFWCLAGDPRADHPRARVVDDDGLAAALRDQLLAVAEPLLDWQVPGVRLGRRQRWGLLTDVVDEALQVAAREEGDRGRGASVAARVLGPRGAPVVPFVAGSTQYRFVDPLGRVQWTRERATCCYSFRLPPPLGDACLTCPRTPAAVREAAATSWDDEGRPGV